MKNKEAVKQKIHVKKGDKVVVISGKDKGKIGEVKELFAKRPCNAIAAKNSLFVSPGYWPSYLVPSIDDMDLMN